MKNLIAIVIMLSIIWTACSNNHTHDDPATNEELAAEVYTIYSEKTELFVEFTPMIKGMESRFAAHFTVLGELFSALSEGTVSLTLEVNGKSQKIVANQPEVPGIFRLRLTPENIGNGKLIFNIKTKTYTDEIIIENVKIYSDEKAALADATEEQNSNDITYLKEQAWKVDFANISVKKIPYHEVINASGQLLSATGDEILISSPASGKIIFQGSKIISGELVNTSSKLFLLTGSGTSYDNIDSKFVEAKTNYEKAKAEYERFKILSEDKIVSSKDLENAKANFENTRIVFENISQNYESGKGISIKAGAEGYLNKIYVTDGQYVNSGDMLASISKNKKMRLVVNVSQQHYDKLNQVSGANFRVAGSDEAFQTALLNGKISAYGRNLYVNSPYIPVTFELDQPANLTTGSVVEVFLFLTPKESAIVVPVTSLIEEQGNFYVYVQTGGESFQKREVIPGTGDGINVPLLSGVAEGERIVTKGGYQIKLSSASGSIPAHGHEH